jgi:dTDP-4-amino-4,6-dideoxygalactose transaminase
MRNFGHNGTEKFNGVGINGKNSEFHAAMGLCVLEDINSIIQRRQKQSNLYDTLLEGLPIQKPKIQEECDFNYAYYPVLFESEVVMVKIKSALEVKGVFSRRYFYPSLSSLNYVTANPTPISDDCASRILCLPLYYRLEENSQVRICEIIKSNILC